MADPNFKNRTLWTGDNLHVMRGLNAETVDLIYLDPPFNSNRDYAAPIGSEAAGAAFKDTWTLSDVDHAWHGEIAEANPGLYRVIDAAREAHGKGMQSYLIMMAVRLLEMKRLLKDTGSVYLHCDPTASHYLKLVMDTVFGHDAYKNEITWRKYGGYKNTAKRKFTTETDTLLYYTKSDAFTFNQVFRPLSEGVVKAEYKHVDEDGRKYAIPRGRMFRQGIVKHVYLDEHKGVAVGSLWAEKELTMQGRDTQRTGYPTQKPLALLERIINASSNENDVVLDPFCGCATALVAAEKLGRQWVGIDLSPKAQDLIQMRMRHEWPLWTSKTVYRDDVPQRTDLGKLPPYKTHKHTLYGLQEGHCAGCRHIFEFRNFTVDHIVARANGGTNHIDNLQLLCGACNSMKGKGSQEAFLAALKREGMRSGG